MKRKLVATSVILVLVLVTACTTLQVSKSVAVTQATVHGALNAYGLAYRAGQVSPDLRTKIEAAYTKYQHATDTVLDTLAAGGVNSADLTAKVAAYTTAMGDLWLLIKDFK